MDNGSSYLNPAGGGGGPLVRQSSFDRKLMALYASLSGDNVESIMTMQNWCKSIFKMLKVRSELCVIKRDFSIFNEALAMDDARAKTFDESQAIFSSPNVLKSLEKVLIALPKDINLKTKNNVTRSSRFCLTALLISKYPGELLLVEYSPDTSKEAMDCLTAAKLYVLRLRRLVNYIQRFTTSPASSSSSSLSEFKRLLISYRFVTRNYLEIFEIWKRLDSERMVHTLEMTYSDAYALYISTDSAIKNLAASSSGSSNIGGGGGESPTASSSGNIILQQQAAMIAESMMNGTSVESSPSPDAILKSLQAELSKIEGAITNLAKSIPSYNSTIRLEELRAIVEAQFSIFLSEHAGENRPESPSAVPKNESINMKIAKNIQKMLSQIRDQTTGDVSGSSTVTSRTPPGAIPANVDKLLDKIFHFHNLNMQKSLAIDSLFGDKINLLSELLVAAESKNAADMFQFGVERHPETLPVVGFYEKYLSAPATSAATSASGGGGRDMTSIVDKFKENMLCLIEDRMLSSLKPSRVKSTSSLSVGDVVQVLNDNSGHFYHTARVTSLNSDFSDSSSASIDASINIKYLVDAVEERDVLITRVKLAPSTHKEFMGEPPGPSELIRTTMSFNTMFLEQHESILDRIESLTPNLKSSNPAAAAANPMVQLLSSLRSPIALAVPPAFLTINDWSNICFNVYNLLMSLQASARAKTMTYWVTSYLERIKSAGSVSAAAQPSSSSSSGDSSAGIFQPPIYNWDWMDYIPVWFRFCNMTIDVIANDISNYYLSVLGSTIDKNKVYEAVSFSFADRYLRYTTYQEDNSNASNNNSSSGFGSSSSGGGKDADPGKIPIEGTIQFLLSQLYTGANRKVIIKKAIELGVLVSANAAADIEQLSTVEQFTKILSASSNQLINFQETLEEQKPPPLLPPSPPSSSFSSSSSSGGGAATSIVGGKKNSDIAYVELIVYSTYLQTFQEDILKVIQGLNVDAASNLTSKSIVNSLEPKLPEMTLLDLPRLTRLVKAMAHTTALIGFATGMKQLLMKFGICQCIGGEYANLENEFIKRLDVLIFEESVEDRANIEHLLAECSRFTNKCLDKCPDKTKFPDTASLHSQITSNMSKIILSPSSPVILLLLSRLNQLLLFCLICNTNKQSVLFPNCSETVSKRIQTVIKMAQYIMPHIFKAHFVIYQSILGSPDFASLMEA